MSSQTAIKISALLKSPFQHLGEEPIQPNIPAVTLPITTHQIALERVETPGIWFKKGVINLLWFPVVPLIGYYCLDAVGITQALVSHSVVLQKILGEGFGHAGLCYGLHFIFKAAQQFYKGLTLINKA